MVEYGGVVSQGTGAVAGSSSSRSWDLGRDVMGVFSDLVDQIAALPPEGVVIVAAIVMLGGFVLTRRPA